jgi:PAS domain S-box-containing protein
MTVLRNVGINIRNWGLTPAFVIFLVALIGLPAILYSALKNHAENEALRDARSMSAVITIVRSYYAANVSARLLQSDTKAILSENYHQIPGAVPIPATLSIELGDAIRQRSLDGSFLFHFVSDAPFKNRVRQPLDKFQTEALRAFRREDGEDELWRVESEPGSSPRMRLAIPVRMEKSCVGCHNAHPDSTATNWKVGDVRGIQDVSVDLSLTGQAQDSWLLSLYLVFFASACLVAMREYQLGNSSLRRLNQSPFAIIMCDPTAPSLPVCYVNKAFQRQTGYLASEVLGRSLQFLHGPESSTDAVRSMRECMLAQAEFEIDILSYRRDGKAFPSHLLGFPSADSESNLPRYVVCLTDRLSRADA